MKLLEKEFVKNCEGVGDTTFKQMKKQESNGLNVYIYNRTKKGFNTYEVFISKRRFKGQPLPGGNVEAEDREQYPTANAFGFTAKEVRNMAQAEVEFQKFLNKNDKEEDKEVKAGLNYPARFSMKDLLVSNPSWTQPSAYVQLQKDIKDGKIKEVARVKSATGRGKPAVIYSIA
jgi:hypothetical protein